MSVVVVCWAFDVGRWLTGVIGVGCNGVFVGRRVLGAGCRIFLCLVIVCWQMWVIFDI